jgi:hypothetical protein
MRELLATERVVLDAIITLFDKFGNDQLAGVSSPPTERSAAHALSTSIIALEGD